MDDLHKDALSVWKLRIKLEGIKKKIRKIEVIMETEEFYEAFDQTERQKIKDDMVSLKKDRRDLEKTQLELEEKIGLPNPYLNQAD